MIYARSSITTHSVCVNGVSIGATLGGIYGGRGAFVVNVVATLSAVKVGDILISIQSNLAKSSPLNIGSNQTTASSPDTAPSTSSDHAQVTGVDSGVVSLMDLTLQEIQAIIQSTPRPCSLVIRRGTGLDEISQPLTFLQCQARGPAFLCSVQDPKQKETVDLYLTLAHLNTLSPKLLASHTVTKELLARGLTPATLLRSTTSEWTTEESTSTSDSDVSTSLALDMSLYQDRPGSNGLDSSCVTCDEPMTNNASQLLKNLQSKVEWLLYQYVTSVQGASRMAYLNGAKFAAWTLAHVVSDPELLRGFYFYAHACDLQKCFAGLRIGMTMIATGAENMANTLSPENLLHLSCIMPNSSELCKFVNRNVQIGSKVSVHKAAFGTNTKLEIEYTTHLVLFTNKNVTSVWLKKRRVSTRGYRCSRLAV